MSRPKTDFLIADLRRIGRTPPRTLSEALRVARLQAKQLLLLTKTYQPPVDPAILATDPKIELRYTDALRQVSGLCRWVGWRYVIAVSTHEPAARQRFTIFHEFKHAVDGAATTKALERLSRDGRRSAAEYVADYFAGCVLIPEPWLIDALQTGQSGSELAGRFGVSKEALRIRLGVVGLTESLVGGGR